MRSCDHGLTKVATQRPEAVKQIEDEGADRSCVPGGFLCCPAGKAQATGNVLRNCKGCMMSGVLTAAAIVPSHRFFTLSLCRPAVWGREAHECDHLWRRWVIHSGSQQDLAWQLCCVPHKGSPLGFQRTSQQLNIPCKLQCMLHNKPACTWPFFTYPWPGTILVCRLPCPWCRQGHRCGELHLHEPSDGVRSAAFWSGWYATEATERSIVTGHFLEWV